MPNPNAHDQPAEGGREVIEHTLQKQTESKQNKKPASGKDTGNTPRRSKDQDRNR